MTEEPLERRTTDVGSLLGDLRVSVARIEATQLANAKTMERLEGKLDLGIFREEYERRHKELSEVVTTVANDYQRRVGQEQIWRIVYGLALAVVSAVAGALAFGWKP